MDSNFANLSEEFEQIYLEPQSLTSFRLFDLPPELWLRICEVAVISPVPVNVTRVPFQQQQAQRVQQPAITRTCRLLRQEALPMFYKNNTFEAWHFCQPWTCPRQWLLAIGRGNLLQMGRLKIYTQNDKEFWQGCFERAGLKDVEIREVEGAEVEEPCPAHKNHLTLDTVLVTFR
ncbi:hypothetical protein BAUCODRAFT_21723 [Baudoinia panamericana UAMH 10762]|uniref:F-box domain-containing protein n=1 Tax=Baudoinia panamericana (strain UAMH 10762) TaxID=717646 RepID=M2NKT5_BAUPA|nr:uncharacterized protein BAUCODRAFT_21723 [Baudoinia panamericana UAMH 10762]EMD00060.1 hypothetical protein BAUCODRAFT_21723 [Baudoinia panamericana UAMH 10762]